VAPSRTKIEPRMNASIVSRILATTAAAWRIAERRRDKPLHLALACAAIK